MLQKMRLTQKRPAPPTQYIGSSSVYITIYIDSCGRADPLKTATLFFIYYVPQNVRYGRDEGAGRVQYSICSGEWSYGFDKTLRSRSITL